MYSEYFSKGALLKKIWNLCRKKITTGYLKDYFTHLHIILSKT